MFPFLLTHLNYVLALRIPSNGEKRSKDDDERKYFGFFTEI